MDRNTRYERLRSEEESEDQPDATPAPEVLVDETATSEVEVVTVVEIDPADIEGSVKVPEPPSYNVATSLPTYEEAEQTKEADEQFQQQRQQEQEAAQNTISDSNPASRVADVYLGTDGIFICAFLVAFVFNCLGLFAILCVSQTVAARFGAISGFGLSLVKYVALVKYQNWMSSWSDGYSWLWWFMLFLGVLMFFRGCMQYVRVKHQWTSLSPQTRGRIYLYL